MVRLGTILNPQPGGLSRIRYSQACVNGLTPTLRLELRLCVVLNFQDVDVASKTAEVLD